MELIKVNTAKLKVILTPNDIQELDIDSNSFDSSSHLSQKAFRNILLKAKEKVGFDAYGCKLYADYFPSRDGGGELYLTRKAKILPEEDSNTSYRKKCILNTQNHTSQSYIVIPDNLDTLISLCQKLSCDGFSFESTLYYHKGKYYLYIYNCQNKTDIPCYICEYGNVFFADSTRLFYLLEHADTLCKTNAVKIIAQNFKKGL